METQFTPVEVFYSCAEVDVPLLEQLEHHLSVLRRQSQITTWHKRQIVAGEDWQRELDHHLRTASLVLLFISPDFLASDYLYGKELQQAMQRHHLNEARVIPIVLRPCDWTGTPFENLQVIPRNHLALTQWRNRDAGFAEVAKEIRIALKTIHQLRVGAPSITLPNIWQLPFPRNPFFTGREQLLEQLYTQLQIAQAMAISQLLAISGLGGIGKTQLAIEYAYRYRQRYQAVLWARADTTEALNTSYREIARTLNLPQQDAQEQRVLVQAVKNWLQGTSGWLLILDNADDLSIVRPFLPSAYPGHIVLTTRAQAMGKVAQRLEIESLDAQTGAVLLLRRAGVIAADAPLNVATDLDQSLALALAEELGGLPLALDQAGAYIEETQGSLSDYQQQYQTRRAVLLARRGTVIDEHPEPVSTTWSLSFEKVEQANPLAAEILCCSSILAPDAIPEELIIQVMRRRQLQDEEGSCSALAAEMESQQNVSQLQGELNEALAVLRAYSLLYRNPVTKTFSIHRLVQAVQQDAMDADTHCLWAKRTILAVNDLFPTTDSVTSWELCRRYVIQALKCKDFIIHYGFTFSGVADFLFRTARYLYDQGDYILAEPLYRRAFIINEQILGSEHYYTGTTLYGVARVCRALGRYTEAEAYLQRALSIKEQTVGQAHRSTIVMRYNLGRLYFDQARYTEAEMILQDTLRICEQNLGSEHSLTGHILYNLGNLSHIQENDVKAEEFFRYALAIYKKTLSENDPSIATVLSALAELMEGQCKYAEARSLYQGALHIREQVWGLEHPSTQIVQKKYSSLLQVMDLHEEANQERT